MGIPFDNALEVVSPIHVCTSVGTKRILCFRTIYHARAIYNHEIIDGDIGPHFKLIDVKNQYE